MRTGRRVDADRALAAEDVHECVELRVPRQVEPRAGRDRRVRVRDGRVRVAGTAVAVEVAGDHAHERAGVDGRQQLDLARAQVLVPRLGPLQRLRQVHPQLRAVEQAAAGDERLRRLLDVQDAGAGRHPLGVAVRDEAAAAVRVLMLEGAVDDVRDGLEPAVRVPRRALGLAGRVLHLAHLVHVDERVEIGEVDAGERAADREALALEAARRGRDGADGPLGLVAHLPDTGQRGDVVDGDCWHGVFPPHVSRPITANGRSAFRRGGGATAR